VFIFANSGDDISVTCTDPEGIQNCCK